MTDLAPKLVACDLRRPGRGWRGRRRVPMFPTIRKLAQPWWKNVAVAVTGEKTPQQAMDNLAEGRMGDQVMGRLERAAWRAVCRNPEE